MQGFWGLYPIGGHIPTYGGRRRYNTPLKNMHNKRWFACDPACGSTWGGEGGGWGGHSGVTNGTVVLFVAIFLGENVGKV